MADLGIDNYLKNAQYTDNPVLELPLFMKIVPSQNQTAIHTHKYTELIIVLSGEAEHIGNGITSRISARDVLIIPEGGSHAYLHPRDLTVANLMFSPDKLAIPALDLVLLPGYHTLFKLRNDFFIDRHPYPNFQLSDTQFEEIVSIVRAMDTECRERRRGGNFRLLGAFMQLIGKLADFYPESLKPANSNSAFQIGTLISYLNTHFHQQITLADLLKRSRMSRSTLTRRFIAASGKSPIEYLLSLRLTHAAGLLASTDLTVAEIAVKSGFTDSSYFTRVFRRTYHLTPREFRGSRKMGENRIKI